MFKCLEVAIARKEFLIANEAVIVAGAFVSRCRYFMPDKFMPLRREASLLGSSDWQAYPP